MTINHTIKAAAMIAAVGLLAACSTPSVAQVSMGSGPMMQGQMKDHMSMKDMDAQGAGQMDMKAMHQHMMKHMKAMANMDMSEGMMGDLQMSDQMMRTCMKMMGMKAADAGQQKGSPHHHGKTKN